MLYNDAIKQKSRKARTKNQKVKTNMKKILSLVLAALMLIGSVAALASCGDTEYDTKVKAYNNYLATVKAPTDSSLPTLTVAVSPDFAPMEFVDLNKKGQDSYVGFDLLLANYLAKEMNMQLLVKPMSFDACMAAVQSGSVDLGISGFSWTAERAETFLISDYYIAGENETEQVVITTAAKANALTTTASYNGLKVGAQGGSLQELLVTEQLVPAGATLVKMESINDLATALLNGQIDALAVAKGNGEALIAANSGNLATSGFQLEVQEKYKNNVVLLNKNDTELCTSVNTALAKALAADYYTGWYEACQVYAEVKSVDEAGFDDNGNKITAAE